MKGFTISGRQRDLLYDVVVDRLTGIDDVWRSVTEGDWEMAQRLGREYSDLLCLVVDDLGWGTRRQEAVELTSPPKVIRGAIEAIRREAAVEDEEQLRQRFRVAETLIDRHDTLELCDELLAKIAGSSAR
jgi:hypothetical protein